MRCFCTELAGCDDYGERQGESESIMYSRTYTAHKTIDLQASSYAMMSPEHEVSSFGGDPSGPRPVERPGGRSIQPMVCKSLGQGHRTSLRVLAKHTCFRLHLIPDGIIISICSLEPHVFPLSCVVRSLGRHSHIVTTPSFLHSGTGRMNLMFSFLVTIVRFMLQMAEWDILQITRNISYITMRAAESSTFLYFWSLPRDRGSIAAASARHGQKR